MLIIKIKLDNYLKFALLAWVAARLAEEPDSCWGPDIVHSHDWHASLVPAYIKATEIVSKTAAYTNHTIFSRGFRKVAFEIFRESFI